MVGPVGVHGSDTTLELPVNETGSDTDFLVHFKLTIYMNRRRKHVTGFNLLTKKSQWSNLSRFSVIDVSWTVTRGGDSNPLGRRDQESERVDV